MMLLVMERVSNTLLVVQLNVASNPLSVGLVKTLGLIIDPNYQVTGSVVIPRNTHPSVFCSREESSSRLGMRS